ncbi:PepSY domain-containing protein [Thalassotalea euphylliae]|uniref:PepSY domain-containing protein n=1 Tax=Thalassotalea euphylliae TaxID=1655234 RepID=A0A3E0TXS7_9GAMM|nr:PepSY domain-containing protein [Thalassotalea euphylliae]REL29250.1 PepSY domain-containing protein [Thalassotalea euphylliae]
MQNKYKQSKRNKSWQQLSRIWHKWLMVVLGVPFLIWAITGLYMVAINIHYIHGNSLVHNHQTKIAPSDIRLPIIELAGRYPNIQSFTIAMLIDKPVYQLTIKSSEKHGDGSHTINNNQTLLVDAQTGAQLSPLSKALALAVAEHEYTGEGEVTSVELIAENTPFELSARHLPVWRIDYQGLDGASIYVSALTGQVVTKRHNYWRVFDYFFRFHLMDYQDGEADNQLLFATIIASLLAVFSGMVLLYFRIKPRMTSRLKSRMTLRMTSRKEFLVSKPNLRQDHQPNTDFVHSSSAQQGESHAVD